MSSLIVRDIDKNLKIQFQALAREEGVSMEEKIRRMIASEVSSREEGLGTRIARIFDGIRGEDYSDFFAALEEIRHSPSQTAWRDPFADFPDDAVDKPAP